MPRKGKPGEQLQYRCMLCTHAFRGCRHLRDGWCGFAHDLGQLLPPDERKDDLSKVWSNGVARWFGQPLTDRIKQDILQHFARTPRNEVPPWVFGVLWYYDMLPDDVCVDDMRYDFGLYADITLLVRGRMDLRLPFHPEPDLFLRINKRQKFLERQRQSRIGEAKLPSFSSPAERASYEKRILVSPVREQSKCMPETEDSTGVVLRDFQSAPSHEGIRMRVQSLAMARDRMRKSKESSTDDSATSDDSSASISSNERLAKENKSVGASSSDKYHPGNGKVLMLSAALLSAKNSPVSDSASVLQNEADGASQVSGTKSHVSGPATDQSLPSAKNHRVSESATDESMPSAESAHVSDSEMSLQNEAHAAAQVSGEKSHESGSASERAWDAIESESDMGAPPGLTVCSNSVDAADAAIDSVSNVVATPTPIDMSEGVSQRTELEHAAVSGGKLMDSLRHKKLVPEGMTLAEFGDAVWSGQVDNGIVPEEHNTAPEWTSPPKSSPSSGSEGSSRSRTPRGDIFGNP